MIQNSVDFPFIVKLNATFSVGIINYCIICIVMIVVIDINSIGLLLLLVAIYYY